MVHRDLSLPCLFVPFIPGTFAVISLMTGSVVERLVPVSQQSNGTGPDEVALLEGQRIGVAAAMAFLVGLLMVSQRVLLGLHGVTQVPNSLESEQEKSSLTIQQTNTGIYNTIFLVTGFLL